MNNNRLGCFTTSGILAAILTALIVLGLGLVKGGTLFNPGALNAQPGAPLGGVTSHADIGGQCKTCHAPFWSSAIMANRCVACHAEVATQWQDPTTLHGVLHHYRPRLVCQNCHPDHRGPDAPLTDMADIRFPHEALGYSLNVHQTKSDGSVYACADCHGKIYTPPFNQTICQTCHAQIDATYMPIHTQDFGKDCLACHDGVETYDRNFDHNALTFPLTGKHFGQPCGLCHINAHSLEDLRSAPQDCYSCHQKEDIHQGRLGSNCGDCHTPNGWIPAKFDHDLAAFKLAGKHVDVVCEKCHINHLYYGTPKDCYSCHQKDDKHNGQFPIDCGSCHNPGGWLPANVDHSLFVFKLDGKHANVACESCHINEIYKDTSTACSACHQKADPHSGQFSADCGACHTTAGWIPSTFDHNLSAFVLTGAHASVACNSCHVNGIYKGIPATCYACHQKDDFHAGRFGTNCGNCHSTSAWLPFTAFNHNLSAFPLTGAHDGLACNRCHANNVYLGTPAFCAACHAEPALHAGIFGTDCAQCHNTSNWYATFNHPGGCEGNCATHRGATCADCHPVNFSSHTCLKCHDSNNPKD